MVLLGRAILIGAIPSVMVLQKRDSVVFPLMSIGGITDHSDTIAIAIQSGINTFIVPKRKKRAEVEHAT